MMALALGCSWPAPRREIGRQHRADQACDEQREEHRDRDVRPELLKNWPTWPAHERDRREHGEIVTEMR